MRFICQNFIFPRKNYLNLLFILPDFFLEDYKSSNLHGGKLEGSNEDAENPGDRLPQRDRSGHPP